ncbi:hypothetical protein ACTMTI_49195 [Nonomuraea sp. H19]|uniref:hypothetical protein n=1 Tax=Nonomuraea sp. H19 TaxID=3452206 RepID=UPI003F89C7DC
MADYEFSDDLVAAQRAFYVQQAVIERLTALEPRPTLIAAGKASVPEKLSGPVRKSFEGSRGCL